MPPVRANGCHLSGAPGEDCLWYKIPLRDEFPSGRSHVNSMSEGKVNYSKTTQTI